MFDAITESMARTQFTAGRMAKKAGVNIQTLRYYERIKLLKPASRTAAGYRIYESDSLQRLLFIKRAQDLGFTLNEIRELLALSLASSKSREKVQERTRAKIQDIQKKLDYLKNLKSNLQQLLKECESGTPSGPCPILAKLGGVA